MLSQRDLLRAIKRVRACPYITAEEILRELLVVSLKPHARNAYVFLLDIGRPVSIVELGDYLGLKQNHTSNVLRSLTRLDLVKMDRDRAIRVVSVKKPKKTWRLV